MAQQGGHQKSSGPKRSGSPSDHTPQSRPAKQRRAAKACVACHRRKVRCDVVHSNPCTNCKLDNVECVERQRLRPGQASGISRSRPEEIAHTAEQVRKMASMLPRPSSLLDGKMPMDLLPSFFYPLPMSRLEESDINYLYDRGALTIPEVELQNALVEAYIQYIHPYMPVLDVQSFLNTLHYRDPIMGRTSLLLYQAIMFAATAFVDMKHLNNAGHTTRKEARKFYFNKAKLLYNFDCEPNRLTLVQTLLLMTYWHDTADGQKDIWHWIGVAVSMAHTIDLQRDPEGRSADATEYKLRKRLWWSCFARDRLIALATRKPTKIWEEDGDVPMLEESDFEFGVLAEGNSIISPNCRLVRDTELQKQLAHLFMEKTKLCIYMGHILKAQYFDAMDMSRSGQSHMSSTLRAPNVRINDAQSLQKISSDLDNWFKNLPLDCLYRETCKEDMEPGNTALAINRTVLYMVYYATLMALHRPWSRMEIPEGSSVELQQTKESSERKAQAAATNITQISYGLYQHQLGRFLPAVTVILLVPAAATHLDNMSSEDQQVKDKAAREFFDCMQVLNALRETFYGADWASVFLGAALVKKGIDSKNYSDKTTAEFIRQMASTAHMRA